MQEHIEWLTYHMQEHIFNGLFSSAIVLSPDEDEELTSLSIGQNCAIEFCPSILLDDVQPRGNSSSKTGNFETDPSKVQLMAGIFLVSSLLACLVMATLLQPMVTMMTHGGTLF